MLTTCTVGSSRLRLQKYADVDLGMPMLLISYIAEENESTVWPGMTA